MVYIKQALVGAVAIGLASGVSALPAAHPARDLDSTTANRMNNDKRDGPMVVQAKSVQGPPRGYYGGGGSEAKQAPLMKASKLFRSKRSIVEPRGTHIHKHVHIDDDDYEAYEGYDPNHSVHWNYHHGYLDHEPAVGLHRHHHNSHKHHSKKSLVNVQALNFGSNVGGKTINRKTEKNVKNIKKVQKCSGSHYHCNNHKRNERSHDDEFDGDDESEDVQHTHEADEPRLQRRRKGSKHSDSHDRKHGKATHKHPAAKKPKKGGNKKHSNYVPLGKEHVNADAHVNTRYKRQDDEDAEEDGSELQARSPRHHGWRHGHSHVHSHVHKRQEESNEALERRRHQDSADAWLDDMTYNRYYEDGQAHIHLHEHDHGHRHGNGHHHWARDLSPEGMPGFVEVASTLFHSNLAKSVAGLVFSKDPEANSSDFLLGTSEDHSTQFYLTPTTTPASAGSTNDTGTLKTYQLRIPVLDSKTLETNDHCATFDVKPPSPLSMQPCGEVEGFSQTFSYNTTTGELTPIYPATSAQPAPLNAAVKMDDAEGLVSAATNGVSDASALPTPTSSSTGPAPSDSMAGDASSLTPAPKVSLYFIPSSSYYASTADEVDHAEASALPAASTDGLFSPPAQAKLASPVDDSDSLDDAETDADVLADEQEQDPAVFTTTVYVTSTLTDAAQPTAVPTTSADLSGNAITADSSSEELSTIGLPSDTLSTSGLPSDMPVQ